MNGGHQATGDAECVMNHLGHGGQAIGGAGRIGHDVLTGIGLVIHAHDEHGRFIL